MAEPSAAPPDDAGVAASPFPRGRLVFGIILVTLVAAGAALAIARLGGGGAGALLYLDDADLMRRELGSGQTERVAELPRAGVGHRLDPGGRRLAYGVSGEVFIWDLSSGEVTQPPDPSGTVAGWTPDGDLVVARPLSGDRTILTALREDGDQVLVAAGLGGHRGAVVWLSEDTFAVHLRSRDRATGQLHVISIASGLPSHIHRIPDAQPFAASPDGAQLLYGIEAPPSEMSDGPCADAIIHRLEVLTVDGFASSPVGLSGAVVEATASAEGVLAVSIDTCPGDPGLWILASQPDDHRRLAGEPVSAVWSADGTALLGDDGALVAWTSPNWDRTVLDSDGGRPIGVIG